MSNLISFSFENAAVRVVKVDGEPWFVGKDVADMLGYRNPQKAVRDHCRRPKSVGVNKSFTPSDLDPQTVIISEPDVMRLIVSSKLPAAERFERWVFEEVLPSIRKTGSYAVQQAQSSAPQLPPAGNFQSDHWAQMLPSNGPSATLSAHDLLRVWRLCYYLMQINRACEKFGVIEGLNALGNPAGRIIRQCCAHGYMLGVSGIEKELSSVMEAAREYMRDVRGIGTIEVPIE